MPKLLSGMGGVDRPKSRQEKIRTDGNKPKGMAMLCKKPRFKDLLSLVICFTTLARSSHYKPDLPLHFSTNIKRFCLTYLQIKWNWIVMQPPCLKCNDTTSSDNSFPLSLKSPCVIQNNAGTGNR